MNLFHSNEYISNMLDIKRGMGFNLKNKSSNSIFIVFFIILRPWDTDGLELRAKRKLRLSNNLTYVVSMYQVYSDNCYCFGTLARSDLVLTACNCVCEWGKYEQKIYTKSKGSIKLVAGSKAINQFVGNYQLRGVSKYHIHPNCTKFNNLVWVHNLAFIETTEPFLITEHVQIAPFPSLDPYEIKASLRIRLRANDCSIVGWLGSPNSVKNGEIVELKNKQVKIVDHDACKGVSCTVDRSFCFPDQGENVCVKPKTRMDTLCMEEFGTPLICGDEIWGVLGYKPECNQATPAIFTALASNEYFFKSTINKNSVPSTYKTPGLQTCLVSILIFIWEL